jgi:hypothetical protein
MAITVKSTDFPNRAGPQTALVQDGIHHNVEHPFAAYCVTGNTEPLVAAYCVIFV